MCDDADPKRTCVKKKVASYYWKTHKVIFCLNSNKVHHPCYGEDNSMRSKGVSRISSFWNRSPWRLTALWSSTVTTDLLFRPDLLFYIYEEGVRKRKEIYLPPSSSLSGFVVSPSLQILWSTNLCAAYTRHKGSAAIPEWNQSQICWLDQADSLLLGLIKALQSFHGT